MTLVFLLGILFGVKHAMEPDHVTSLLALCANDQTMLSSMKISLCWGVGHTATLTILAIIILFFKIEVAQSFHHFFEFMVGVILILMGIKLAIKRKSLKLNSNQYKLKNNINSLNSLPFKALMLGLIHGCAGSGAVILFTLNEFGALDKGLLYIFVFSVSLVISISIVPLIMHIPVFRTSANTTKTEVINIVAVISVLYGLSMIYAILI